MGIYTDIPPVATPLIKIDDVIVTDFAERCNLVGEGNMFVKDEGKIMSRVGGVKLRVVYFGKLGF